MEAVLMRVLYETTQLFHCQPCKQGRNLLLSRNVDYNATPF
jgi:hypothetical protein